MQSAIISGTAGFIVKSGLQQRLCSNRTRAFFLDYFLSGHEMYVKMIRNISDQDAGDFVSCVYWGYGTAGLRGGV